MAALDAGMAKDLAAGDHLEGDAAEAQADADVDVAAILALARPQTCQVLKMVITQQQVVGDAEDGGAEGAVAVAHQRAIGFVYLIALVTGRTQAGTAGDTFGD